MSQEKWFIQESELDDYQYNVKQLNPEKSYIISGSAGSGKTILALWRAKELQETNRKDFFIIVYTKALRQFIEDGIREIGIDSAKVIYEWEWENKLNSPEADYIIIDEAQDFTQTEIENFLRKSKKSIMFFGDTAQQLYDIKRVMKNGAMIDEETMSIARITDLLRLPMRDLVFNYRLPKKIARFAEHIMKFEDELEKRCKKEGGDLPIVKQCRTKTAELDFIITTIKKYKYTDVGIVLPYKKDVKYVFEYFNSKGMNPEAKFNIFNENLMSLDFTSSNPKIMPYHSSKGLQFETVFIPFCEIDDVFFQNPLYVAITRTTKNLFITYSGKLSKFINKVPHNFYKLIDLNSELTTKEERETPF